MDRNRKLQEEGVKAGDERHKESQREKSIEQERGRCGGALKAQRNAQTGCKQEETTVVG